MKLTSRLLALPAMIALITACGEATNNLTNPVVNEGETTTTCQDKDYCVVGQFIDEPVVGLNYTCNLVEGITDADGVFVCPNNSVANFFLKSATGSRKIHIGKYRVRALGGLEGNLIETNLIVTPQDLVVSTEDKKAISSAQVSNILRLLQALDSDGHSASKVTNRIVIDSKDKKAIDELARDISLPDFEEQKTLDDLLKPMFDKIPDKSLVAITAAQAMARFQESLPVIHAGVYEVTPTLISALNNDGSFSHGGMLGKWTGSDLHSMISMFFVVDRDGKTIGNALEWQKSLTSSQLNNNLLLDEFLIKTTPTLLNFNTVDTGFDSKGQVKPNFVLNSQTGTIKLTQGTLSKGVIAGGERFYRNSYGLTSSVPIDETHFGKWQRIGTDNAVQLNGAFNMQNYRAVNAYLDGSIWQTKDNIVVGEKPIFPLHFKITLSDGDRTTACGGASGLGCLVGEMGVTILENGNIITDRDNDCSDIDATTLQDQGDDINNAVMQEHRLGMVTTVLRDSVTQKAAPLIVPVMLVGSWASQLPNTDPWQKFYGIYIGAQAGFPGGTKVEIDISRVLDKIIFMRHQQDEQERSGVVPFWTNYTKYMQHYSMSEQDKEKVSPTLRGLVTNVQTQTCYNPQPKI